MSAAWEVTQDDVANVLIKHGKITDYDDPLVSQAHDAVDADEVEDAVLAYTDFDDQSTAALAQIESQLIAEGYINEPRLFTTEP